MMRLISIALLSLFAFGDISLANDGECCGHCGCKLHCQVVCEWATREVLRYKADPTECPPPCCVCCDDRWIIGCPKPIKILSLKPHYEKKKYLVGQHVVRTCPECNRQDSAPLPNPEKSAPPRK
jgi:hypothetical protein